MFGVFSIGYDYHGYSINSFVNNITFFFFTRVQHLHQRWISIRTLLHNRLLSVLASISFPIEEKSVTRMSKTVLETRLVETDVNFRQVQEVAEWIKNKQVNIYVGPFIHL